MNPFAALIDLIIARECHVCGCALIDDERFICSSCASRLPVSGYDKYWRNVSGPNTDLNPMEQRLAGQLPLGRACGAYFYTRDSSLATLVHDFKYRGFSRLAITLGRLGANTLKDSGLFSGVDVLLPVPLHWRKRWRRGYNQSELIARGVSEVTGIPIGSQLIACKPHRTQTSLSSTQRIENTKGVFGLKSPDTLYGLHVMLVDDICTTGATLLAAGEVVAREVRGVKISAFTLGVV